MFSTAMRDEAFGDVFGALAVADLFGQRGELRRRTASASSGSSCSGPKMAGKCPGAACRA
jgi:hypothetical protein